MIFGHALSARRQVLQRDGCRIRWYRKCGSFRWVLAAFIFIVVAAFRTPAQADLLTSQTDLDGILGDQVQIEDFEGFSLHGGTFQDAPNPLNSSTAPAYMGIQPGVTYSSPRWLRFYATTLLGDDSIVLAGDDHIDVEFHQTQLAVGLYTKNITGNLDYQNTISFYRGDQLLGSVDYVLPSGGWTFYGWRDPLGVDRISVNSSNAWAIVDNIEWGIAVPEPSMGVLLLMVLAGVSSVRRRRQLCPATQGRATRVGSVDG